MSASVNTLAAQIEALPRQQKRLFDTLLRGGHYSVADIAIIIGQSDPRGHISRIRRKGLTILDEWCETEHGDRYKRYFLPKDYLTYGKG